MPQGIEIGLPASEDAADSLGSVEVLVKRCECHHILSRSNSILKLLN
jgi:hypothetical protein